ncbi:MAG: hypothetical protein A2945_02415 [Candidatus Liptonbacteria bacterium RIFCSPLOWO2_01_FULL_52_25]|uniref:Uncharacterized protein n=1 Tax=Candidatus Liptonbacteria bacterium RIFCSPLOWO2_01_FULL_52_25 TaxID=1798650 RepID=A0A1G2CEM1_9BACT|nr:MAG: hypothetical protein A2945_02415 [Candidatus Liptonbacteria bacterium RIFCSPLOWO2_01_FULL_52_25]
MVGAIRVWHRAKMLKSDWMKMPTEHFETLHFGELKAGDHFIALPTPGDNEGHGGLRQPHRLYIKANRDCARRYQDGVKMALDQSLRVVKVE